ncbi:hypothetical protein ACFSC3_10445 [Sphingomonas floccifaciens]|uniref:Uncharacterized protein n=1 Tax=Sphingomonas floccifaciens TaxID=1844115 RepID=A0ABW4NEL5_9SPHN
MTEIKETVDETMTVAPDADDADRSRQKDAGHDTSIEERLQRNPESKEARLDRALDESMDASDPPATTQPVHNHGPAPSSGFDEEAEKARQRDA